MSLVDNITARIPFNKKSATPEYFFALNIGLSRITASVWQTLEGKLEILSQSVISYSNTDEFVDKAYQVLDQSLGVLEIEPQKVLFGVPDSWSQDEDLKEPHLKLLRKLLKEADLQPLAYVLTTNAVSFYLQKQEGTPVTAILLGIGDFLESTLIRGGKVIESRAVEHSGELFDDVEKVLDNFHDSEVLPSKILLYPTKTKENMTKVKDQLMSFSWMQKLSFLHFPKIETLDSDICSKSIIAAAASEIDPQVDFKHSFTTAVDSLAERPLVHETSEISEEENLGFIKGDIKDRLAGRHLEENEESDQVEELEEEERELAQNPQFDEDLKGDNLISPDLPEEEFFDNTSQEELPSRPLHSSRLDESAVLNVRHSSQGNRLPAVFQQISQILTPFAAKLHLPKLPSNQGVASKIALVVLVLAGLIAAYLFFAKATVTIFVEPQILEKDAQIVADPAVTAIDETKKVIPGTIVETSVMGSGKTSASGQKQIGDPAKGKVVVYNLSNDKVSVSSGTTLTSSSGLKFSLDTSVQIASQSSSMGADYTEVKKPGKSDSVGVTASVMGPEGNLPADTELSVSGYNKSQVIVRVEQALSGGTSKNVTVVTSDDQQKLKAQVLDDLKQKAEIDLQSKMTDGKKIIADALQVVDGKYTFSKDVNDQASDFSLNATVKFKGVAYSEVDLRTIVGKLVEINVPDGYELDLSSAETQADVVKIEKDGKLVFGAKFKAKLMPKYNESDLKKQMVGKNIEEVVEKLKGLDNVIGSEIKLSPRLPAPLAKLPFLIQNITIVITPK